MKKLFAITTLLTLVFLLIGFFAGIWFDEMRTEEIKNELTNIDIMWNDARLQSLYYQTLSDGSDFCDSAIKSNLEFSEKIYDEGKKIDRYEKANRFSPDLILQKKRHALLQMQFWFNSIKLRDMCNFNYSTVVYLYSHYDDSLSMKQKIEGAALLELKEKYGSSMMLIPLPSDIGILSVDAIKSQYNITEMPAVIVNEKYVFQGLTSKEKIEEALFKS
ncbi:MAG: hypothetical protein J7L08_03805 [Candidatus Aenigmarchaeota archaeon]|nr:hypothetical protein [Candidatus Aenigmarchaeota archaeon]